MMRICFSLSSRRLFRHHVLKSNKSNMAVTEHDKILLLFEFSQLSLPPRDPVSCFVGAPGFFIVLQRKTLWCASA
jgi:hypothetical protein